LVLGLLGESLETEETGGIAFLDGYFKVTGGVEKRQFFPFPHVGVAFADPVNDFVPLKDDTEVPSLALFLKLFAGDVDLHVGLLSQIGETHDFELEEVPGLPMRAGATPVTRAAIERYLKDIFAPFRRGIRMLKVIGLDRLVIHGLPPRSADDEKIQRWTSRPCRAGVRGVPAATDR